MLSSEKRFRFGKKNGLCGRRGKSTFRRRRGCFMREEDGHKSHPPHPPSPATPVYSSGGRAPTWVRPPRPRQPSPSLSGRDPGAGALPQRAAAMPAPTTAIFSSAVGRASCRRQQRLPAPPLTGCCEGLAGPRIEGWGIGRNLPCGSTQERLLVLVRVFSHVLHVYLFTCRNLST